MTEEALRQVRLERTSRGRLRVTNARGATLAVGSGEDSDFTPVELLLTALAGCTAIDVDFITGRRAEPERFEVSASAVKIRDAHGNRLVNLTVDFDIDFPDDESGQAAESVLERAVAQSHDRICTVTRTVEVASPVTTRIDGRTVAGPTESSSGASAPAGSA